MSVSSHDTFYFSQQQKRMFPDVRRTPNGSGEFRDEFLVELKLRRGRKQRRIWVILMPCSQWSSVLFSERRMKPLLPRTESYLVPIQLPVASSVYLPSSSSPFVPSCSQLKRNTSRGTKRVRIAPKVKTLIVLCRFLSRVRDRCVFKVRASLSARWRKATLQLWRRPPPRAKTRRWRWRRSWCASP